VTSGVPGYWVTKIHSWKMVVGGSCGMLAVVVVVAGVGGYSRRLKVRLGAPQHLERAS